MLESPATRSAGRGLLGVEAEIAFRLGEDLAPQEALAVIELCETRLADWQKAPTLWKLADFQSNAALVIGNGTRDWRGLDFQTLRAELRVNGALKAHAVGGHPAGDPALLLPWMREHCASRGRPLRAGDVVTTGSWVGIVRVSPGDEVLASFSGVGEAHLSLR